MPSVEERGFEGALFVVGVVGGIAVRECFAVGGTVLTAAELDWLLATYAMGWDIESINH